MCAARNDVLQVKCLCLVYGGERVSSCYVRFQESGWRSCEGNPSPAKSFLTRVRIEMKLIHDAMVKEANDNVLRTFKAALEKNNSQFCRIGNVARAKTEAVVFSITSRRVQHVATYGRGPDVNVGTSKWTCELGRKARFNTVYV